MWEGDRAFLKLLAEDRPFFTMKLSYKGYELTDIWTKVYEDTAKDEQNQE